jgi:hypothetical protein
MDVIKMRTLSSLLLERTNKCCKLGRLFINFFFRVGNSNGNSESMKVFEIDFLVFVWWLAFQRKSKVLVSKILVVNFSSCSLAKKKKTKW